MIIEDNPQVRENTAELLELADYQVLCAPDGKEGVQLAKKEHPDLIICDIMMPILDGYGVLHILSKDTETTSIPFIFLTAKAERSDFRKAMNLGADDYLTKPFEESELLDAVETRLKKSQIIKNEYQSDGHGMSAFLQDLDQIKNDEELNKNRKLRNYRKKSTLFWEQDYANRLIYIHSGRVKTFKTNKDGKQLITGMHTSGDLIGFKALLSGSDYTETAVALEDTEVYQIPKEEFFELLYKNRELANKFIRILSNNLKVKEEQLLHLAYHNVRQRVAKALISLQSQYKVENQNNGFSISREDFAAIVGTAPESVIRTLSDFKSESLVDITAHEIKLLDEDKLNHIAARGF